MKMDKQQIEPYKNLSLQDMEGEEWRDIEVFEGFYQVSNLGRVKSLDTEVETWKGGKYIRLGRIRTLHLRNRKNGKGKFLVCSLCKNKKSSNKVIKKLVAESFNLTRSSESDTCIYNRDLNHYNCAITNLFYGDSNELSNRVYNAKKNTSMCFYKGVHNSSNGTGNKYFRTQISINGKVITKYSKSEIEAAKKYDYYVKKYKLNRELNFPDE